MRIEALLNLGALVSLLRRIDRKLDDTMATVTEAFADLATQANKAYDEISNEISTLKDKVDQLEQNLSNRELTAEEANAMEEVKTSVQKLDDLVPDEVETTPPADTETPAEGEGEGSDAGAASA